MREKVLSEVTLHINGVSETKDKGNSAKSRTPADTVLCHGAQVSNSNTVTPTEVCQVVPSHVI